MIKIDKSVNADAINGISQYKGKTFVIKYGGSIINNINAQKAFIEDIIHLINSGINIIIVHGGGPEINKWINKIGIKSEFVKGLRVTDEATMEIVEMVLSGKVNKNLTSNLSKYGLNAVGISGKDSNLVQCEKRYVYGNGEKVDIGFVGDVVRINKNFLLTLLEKNMIPVISPIGTDKNGVSYNINADYVAAFVSGVLKAEKLLIVTDVEGVYKDINDPSTLLSSISINEIKEYSDSGIIKGGMLPKLECCVEALEKGAKKVHLVDGRKEHSLLNSISKDFGTKIIKERGIERCQKVV
ncbi:acetylglutamate kinase [Clostridium magnum]|uniref:Acetylglutamate kinase n=1 Tax=Clostridium magnum DSM 2767 TaxID=1121326 RepID=A0A162R8P6_9CLOT|nr:acetylglutamate kinase [Clostridium magnum]KZL89577.1 acetylglutamate kinase [Clostridium magnum DSM 2767]SHH73019.1 N-acetylglutamate kinase [Clostridium magnum DSM 2767]